MSVSPLMHFAFQAAVSFILRFACFLGLYFHIYITVKGKRKESVESGDSLSQQVEEFAAVFGGASCSVYEKGWLFLNLFVWKKCWGKAFRAALWKIFPSKVLEGWCRDAYVQLSFHREKEMEEWDRWEPQCLNYLPSPAVKAGTVQHGASCCSHICCGSSWFGHCISLHTLGVDVSALTFSSCLVRGAVPEGGSAWSLLVACISHAVLCWSRFSALVLPLPLSLWTQKWQGSADCKVHFFC